MRVMRRVPRNKEQQGRIDRGKGAPLSGNDRRAWLLLFVLVLAVVALLPNASAQSAKTFDKRGHDAENRQDYDAAFEAYRQAHLKKPADLRYRAHYERTRFLAASTHIDRGRVLRQSGDVTGAINEFARALEIDPGDEAASQELQLTEKGQAQQLRPGNGTSSGASLAPTPPGGAAALTPVPATAEQTPYQQRVQEEIASIASPVELQPVSNDPITLHMVEDVKNVYQAIGKAAGLNVIFDPEYSSKRIQVDLNSVTLSDALRIVSALSGTFWKPVTSNTLLVAQNNQARRRELEDQAVQTFYLTNVSAQNDANEVQIALRNLLDQTVKIYLVNTQNAIVVRASPEQLILAEKIVNDLDRVHSEVIVDLAVLEVSRDKVRNLGITLPQSFGVTPIASSTSTSSTSTSTSTTSTTTSDLTLNTLANINASNFEVTVGEGTVNALLTDSDTRILQNPRVRATDGQKATLKIGSKIPVATGSYTSTVTATSGVQTQFTYIDVGVNIEMTPTVHYDREISLKMKVEISSQSGTVTIDDVAEPVISQRVVEQTIQLKDGEPSILAGLLERQESRGVSGTPGLGEIPLLKYFFSTQSREDVDDEIVFLLVPHIVRENLLTEENTRPIFAGTSQAVELIRHAPPSDASRPITPVNSGSQTTAANAANAMLGQLAAAAAPPKPPSASTPVSAMTPVSSTPITLAVQAPSAPQSVGSTFQVSISAANAHDLATVPLSIHFDSKVLQLVNTDYGTMLARDGKAVTLTNHDEGNGTVSITADRPVGAPGISGEGPVLTLTFKAIGVGDSAISLVRVGARDSHHANLPAVGLQGVIHVK